MLNGLHFLTHIGLSWIIASLGPGSRRDHWLVVLAGTLPDLDGIGILWSGAAYVAMHRAAGHGLLFGLLLIVIAIAYADSRGVTAIAVALSFHLHLLLDLVGTGGLPIRYLWPISDRGWVYAGRWDLASWPNFVVMALTLAGVTAVAWRKRRTAH
jgi:inner membrane protein